MARTKAPAAEQAPTDKAPAAEQALSLVRMVREPHYPEPHAAKVHPAEVENYKSGGWQVAE